MQHATSYQHCGEPEVVGQATPLPRELAELRYQLQELRGVIATLYGDQHTRAMCGLDARMIIPSYLASLMRIRDGIEKQLDSLVYNATENSH